MDIAHRDSDKHWGMLALFLAIMFAAGGIGNFITQPEIPGWYAGLAKPSWSPPNQAFGIAWSAIFVATAVGTWMTWRRAGWSPRWTIPFALQWGLNIAWSAVFFGMHSPGGALFVIAALWITLVVMMRAYWKERATDGALLVPYIAWVTFAGFLNFAIWRLNP